ncbi:Uncharacterised protein [Providencia rustigianii]|nr:Uncharacterised protein [Providencia rustigianii]
MAPEGFIEDGSAYYILAPKMLNAHCAGGIFHGMVNRECESKPTADSVEDREFIPACKFGY